MRLPLFLSRTPTRRKAQGKNVIESWKSFDFLYGLRVHAPYRQDEREYSYLARKTVIGRALSSNGSWPENSQRTDVRKSTGLRRLEGWLRGLNRRRRKVQTGGELGERKRKTHWKDDRSRYEALLPLLRCRKVPSVRTKSDRTAAV